MLNNKKSNENHLRVSPIPLIQRLREGFICELNIFNKFKIYEINLIVYLKKKFKQNTNVLICIFINLINGLLFEEELFHNTKILKKGKIVKCDL